MTATSALAGRIINLSNLTGMFARSVINNGHAVAQVDYPGFARLHIMGRHSRQ
jgi:hypothetical protein